MHKTLLVLGMLLHQPLHGYEMHRILRAHGELYADLKKANLYYLLDRLAAEGYLNVQTETGTRGARGERLVYELTERGREHFFALLQQTLLTYEPVHTGVETAVVHLSLLRGTEGLRLLEERHRVVAERRAVVERELGHTQASAGKPLVRIAADHLLSLIDAELAWLDRSCTYLRECGWSEKSCFPLQPHD
ncbi:MAG: PadR family transcriptional regulator [Ktedonobacteraceae bacterium]|nr:PadR family transcriptional regulator [Ktedonobacteraceae bacterium]